jgi:hypothetical protein
MRSGIDQVYSRATTMDSTLRHFGDVLFDELKDVIVRRSGVASLVAAKERLEDDKRLQSSDSIRTEWIRIAQNLPHAAHSILELVRVVQLQPETILEVVTKDLKAAKDDEARINQSDGGTNQVHQGIRDHVHHAERREEEVKDIQKRIEAIVVRASDGGGPPANDRTEEQVSDVIRGFTTAITELSEIDRKLKGIADSLRATCGDQRRWEIEESIADAARTAALGRNLVGLQGIADLGLIRTFDYLSTVSGGGYLGGWFAAWVHQEKDLENVQTQLQPRRTQQSEATRRRHGPHRGQPRRTDQPGVRYHARLALVR